jgi:hypothetical protein
MGVGSFYTSYGIRSDEWQRTNFLVHAGFLRYNAPATSVMLMDTIKVGTSL